MTTTHASFVPPRHRVSRVLLAALCAFGLAVSACGDDDAPPPPVDAGGTDLGGDDGGARDGAADDAGDADGGDGDAGTSDAGPIDIDAGADDAGADDASAGDAGPGDVDAGVDAGGPVVCTMPPRTGCCFVDGDCTGPRERCVGSVCDASGEGVCKADPPGADTCWDDKDCRVGTTCMSANICPCGAACFVADSPGVCVPTI
jgi:hypothetical protein